MPTFEARLECMMEVLFLKKEKLTCWQKFFLQFPMCCSETEHIDSCEIEPHAARTSGLPVCSRTT